MSIRKYMNHRTLKIMLAFFMCFVFFTGSIVTITLSRSSEHLKGEYVSVIQADADRIDTYYSQLFLSTFNACNNVFLERWFAHYRNVSGFYQDEFDSLKRKEICDTLNSTINTLPLVEDILIITPSMNSIITKNGWMTPEKYGTIWGDAVIAEGTDLWPVISAADPDKCGLLTVQDPQVRKYKSVVTAVLKIDELFKTFQKMRSAECRYCSISIDSQNILEYGEFDEKLLIVEKSQSLTGLRILIGYPAAQDYCRQRLFLPGVLIYLSIFLFSLLLSMIIALLTTKPVTDMVINMGGDLSDQESPFQFLQAYLTSFSDERRKKYEEDGAQKAKHHFLHLIEREMLFGMLTNPDFIYEDSNLQIVFPWVKEKNVLLIVLTAPCYGNIRLSNTPLYASLKDIQPEFRYVSISDEDVLFFWSKSEDMNTLKQHICEILDCTRAYHYVFTEMIDKWADIQNVYAEAKRILEKKRMNWLEMPVVMEQQLLKAIGTGKIDDCLKWFEEAEAGLKSDSVLKLMTRVALEMDRDMGNTLNLYHQAALKGEWEQQWRILEQCGKTLCEHVQQDHLYENNQQAAAILEYIDTNFHDPDLCIDLLGEVFHIHPSLISRKIKLFAGLTFTDYLQDKRMMEAEKLLLTTSKSINEISEDVGYTSYQTFNRAFRRRFGISPGEYRKDSAVGAERKL